ncbi:MAG: MerR family transcriptional regulator [Candidatus Ancillula sp.]|jgi:DNA-binding transcriptional MerR regulator|nr:MerR family transcriptional regulator [Candidatus Ancillula sp.]
MKLFNVSTTASLTGVHPQTLRHYEKIRLVMPKRTLGGVRRYSQYDIDKVHAIRELSENGINLEGVRIILEQQEEISILKRQIAVNQGDGIFTSGSSGVSFEQFHKLTLRERLRFHRQKRKEERNNSHQIYNRRLLQIEKR